jgi:hypothetical protein
MKKMFLIITALILSFSIISCNDSGVSDDGKQTSSDSSGVVALPDGVGYTNLEVTTLGGFADVESDGTFNAKLPNDMVSFVVVKDKDTEQSVYYGYVFPAGSGSGLLDSFSVSEYGVLIDDASTALTLAMMNPLFFAATLDQKADIAEKIIAHPLFTELTAAITDAREADFYTVLDSSVNRELFVQAKDLAVQAMVANATGEPQAAPELEGESLQYDLEAAWIVAGSGLNMVLKNPTMIYYAAGSYQNGVLIDEYPAQVLPKEKIVDFSLWPPSFEVVDVETTPYTMPGTGFYTVKFYKGIQFDMTVEELLDDDTAVVALLSNTWLTIQMIVSLCGNIGILPGGSVGVDLLWTLMGDIDATWIYELYQAADGGDIMDVINVFVDFFKDNIVSIGGLVAGTFADGDSDGEAASSLIGEAGEIVGIATSLFDMVNTEIPFFYDLITAHESASYNVLNGAVQDNVDDGQSGSNDTNNTSGCSTSPSGNSGIALLMILLPIALIAIRRRAIA